VSEAPTSTAGRSARLGAVRRTLLGLLLAGLAVAGWAAGESLARRETARQRARLVLASEELADSLDAASVADLGAAEDGARSTARKRVERQFEAILAANPALRAAVLVVDAPGRPVIAVGAVPGSGDPLGGLSPSAGAAARAGGEPASVSGPIARGPGRSFDVAVPAPGRGASVVLEWNGDAFLSAVERERAKALVLAAAVAAAALAAYWLRTRLDSRGGPGERLLRIGPPAAVLAVGLAATAAGFTEARRSAQDLLRAEFERHAAAQVGALREAMERQLVQLGGLARLFDSSSAVGRSAFRSYCAPMTVPGQPVQAIEWIPRVTRAQRKAYEAAARADGLDSFQIVERTGEGALRRAAEREEYYPVYYLEPVAGNEAAEGFDLASSPVRRAALEAARDGGRAVATEPVRLVQARGQNGFLVFLPLYGPGGNPRNRGERRAQLKGFVLGVYRGGELVEEALRHQPVQGFGFLIEDLTAAPGRGTLYHREPEGGGADRIAPFDRVLDMAGRDWRIRVVPGAAFVASGARNWYWWILPLGLLLSGIGAFLVERLLNGRLAAVRMVGERTRELVAVQNRLNLALEGAGLGWWDWDVQTGEVVVNERVASIAGYELREISPLRVEGWLALCHPDDVQRSRELLQRHFTGASDDFSDEYRLRRRGGGWAWVHHSGRVTARDAAGRPLRMAGTLADVTARREAQEAVDSAAELRRAVLDRSAVGIFLSRGDRVIAEASQRACDMFGYTRQEILGQSFRAIHVSQETFESFGTQYRQLASSGSTRVEYPFRRRDGSEFWCSVSGTPLDPSDPAKGAIWTLQDVTERRQAEEARRASEERLAHALDATGEGVWEWDLSADVVRHNAQWSRILGIEDGLLEHPASEFMGMLHEQDRGAVLERLRACLRGEGRYQSEHRVRRSGGRVIWVEDRGRVVEWDPEDRPRRFVGSLADISERKRAEEDLRRMNVDLEQAIAQAREMAAEARRATEAKSEFLANMSHEIRTPMNAVLGMTGLLLGTALDDEQRRYAATVQSSGEALLALLNDILDFSKIEAKKLELEELDFDPRALLDDVASMMAVRAREKGLELVSAAKPDVPSRLRGDPVRLRQVLTNLVGNALKFTSWGEVEIRAAVEGASERGSVLRFTVRDSGMGIPADKQKMIFQSFTQVDASTSRRYGGTGLGLAISKQLVELMGGSMGVISAPGAGSEFWFTLPLAVRLVPEPPPGAEALRGVRVLVVDDNATNREVLAAQLSAWGVHAAEATDGPSGIAEIRRAHAAGAPFRVAIVDMHMPGLDGAEVGRAVRADPALDGTRLVMMTSGGRPGDGARTKEIGFSAHLTKPVRHADLRACLEDVLSARPPRGAEGARPANGARPASVRTDAKILLAEDNLTNQQVALGLLKKMSLRAEAVANGAEAVMALEWFPYDLVLMDIQMPAMNGYEAARTIRDPGSKVLNHEVPIIAMTANAMRGDRELCLEAGMNDYVSKPIDPRALAAALARWLPSAEPAGEPGGEPDRPPAPLRSSDEERSTFDRQEFLGRMMGDEALAREVIEGFLADVPRRLEALRRSFDGGDAQAVAREAHSIKGAAANVGAESLRQAASQVETAGRAGEFEAVRRLAPELAACFDAVRLLVEDLARQGS